MCGLIRNEPGFSKTPFCIIIESALGTASRGKEMLERAGRRLGGMVHRAGRRARRVILIAAPTEARKPLHMRRILEIFQGFDCRFVGEPTLTIGGKDEECVRVQNSLPFRSSCLGL